MAEEAPEETPEVQEEAPSAPPVLVMTASEKYKDVQMEPVLGDAGELLRQATEVPAKTGGQILKGVSTRRRNISPKFSIKKQQLNNLGTAADGLDAWGFVRDGREKGVNETAWATQYLSGKTCMQGGMKKNQDGEDEDGVVQTEGSGIPDMPSELSELL
mmetsp:Transcript_35748/g.43152  ORF Transcript_35748/g.43152 Transcript_35748/m.43152 type:complete len:159 (+) Transcript_35748:225-701(+)|eukprot:CAMPEP_0197856830 /NCGR_PEP_ID=MMETSP1438-20131217/29315_1 /TAXON_ID=1461541 /ORGANISM="Pterosperma sp., Strain CCMP1384" /LENGTH=158 /DNA_ID=CAMNT_0043472421 /DNA_START=225 /DNA_END=701 /DNA_ORIENTATION=+